MHGNVWEWCQDTFGPYQAAGIKERGGAADGSDRVRRGGGYVDAPGGCRSSARNGLAPSRRGTDLGLRLALSPSDSDQPEAKP